MTTHALGRVLVIGGINLDTLAVSTAPTVTGTSNPGRTSRSGGGVARNVAENLTRLGSPTRILGAVGDDDAADTVLRPLAELGVDVSGVIRSSHPTGSYTAVLENTGDLVVSVADMAATEAITPEDLGAPANLEADWLIVDGNLLPATVRAVLAQATCPVLLDPVGVAKAERLASLERVPVHTFTPNRQELEAFTGTSDEGEAVASCRRRGILNVWVRDGARGSRVHTPSGIIEVAVIPGPVADVTGAGDSMLAGFVHALNRGDGLEDAARYGAALAALTIASPHPVRPDLSHALVQQTQRRQEIR